MKPYISSLIPLPKRLEISRRRICVREAALLLPEQEETAKVMHRLRAFLRSRKVDPAPVVATPEAASKYPVVFALGDPRRDQRLAGAWRHAKLPQADWEQLGDEGYALGVAPFGTQALVALAGSPGGIRHALSTLCQLAGTGESLSLPRGMVADQPSFPLRGIVEGFYGDPWSHPKRMRVVSFMERVKLNCYLYGPKDDPFHRERWREPYPFAAIRRLGELAEACAQRGIAYWYSVSPGLSISYSDEDDFRSLCLKLEGLREVGITRFAVFFDDIPPELALPRDRAAFGDIGKAQVRLVSRLIASLGLDGLIFCPTQYTGTCGSPYLERIGAGLPPQVHIMWTGTQCCSPKILPGEAASFGQAICRPPLIWDNYPVNDYAPNRLFLGPLEGRDPLLGREAAGIVFNPMNQALASLIPLATAADYAWNPQSYCPERSWEAALKLVGGRSSGLLRTLAEHCRSSFLCDSAPTELAELLSRHRAGDQSAARKVRCLAGGFRRLKREFAAAFPDIFAEVERHLEKLACLGRLQAACLAAGTSAPAVRRRMQALLAEAAENPAEICGDLIDELARRAGGAPPAGDPAPN